MTFFCIDCKGGLESFGKTNHLICLRCECIFEVEIKLRKLDRTILDKDDVRQLSLPRGVTSDNKI